MPRKANARERSEATEWSYVPERSEATGGGCTARAGPKPMATGCKTKAALPFLVGAQRLDFIFFNRRVITAL